VDRPTLEVADIFRRYGDAYRQHAGVSLSTAQGRVMTAIETCRTAALGGHVEQCAACGHQRIAYNSCANRHCPKCQSLARAAWIEHRTAELLACEYFHVVLRYGNDSLENGPFLSGRRGLRRQAELVGRLRRFPVHVQNVVSEPVDVLRQVRAHTGKRGLRHVLPFILKLADDSGQ
jgi:transposase-like zinc-binding protein